MPKQSKQQERRQSIDQLDPSIDIVLQNQERKQAESRLPPKERSAKTKEKRRAQERLPGRVNLDLPVELKQRLFALAEREGVPVSQLAAFLLLDGAARLEAPEGPGLLLGYKKFSTSPKYRHVLDLEQRAADQEKTT